MATKALYSTLLIIQTTGVIITHSYDSKSGTFAETASEATTILIQDYENLNLVITFDGPNLTPAFQAKELSHCSNGAVNYANLLSNFRAKFTTMLTNSGITVENATATTRSKATIEPTTRGAQIRGGRYSDEYYNNTYEIMTAYFEQITTPDYNLNHNENNTSSVTNMIRTTSTTISNK